MSAPARDVYWDLRLGCIEAFQRRSMASSRFWSLKFFSVPEVKVTLRILSKGCPMETLQ